MDGAERGGESTEAGRSVRQRSEAKSRDTTEIAVVTALRPPDERLIARVGGDIGQRPADTGQWAPLTRETATRRETVVVLSVFLDHCCCRCCSATPR